jgi:RNA polymerase sigma-70 factor (ECF subfamily)
MLAVKDGDLDKLGYLFEKHHERLYNLFLHQTGDPQNSEDLVQEVFMRMLKYRHTYRGEGKFTTWMFTIAHNARADFYRRSRHNRDFTDTLDDLVSDQPDPGQLAEKASQRDVLRRAMDRLSEEKREVLVMSRFQQLKYEEISEILGCPVGTIKARVFHAIRELKAFVTEQRDGATQ